MKMVPAICTFLGAIFSCTNYFRVIFTGGVGKNGSTIAVSLETWAQLIRMDVVYISHESVRHCDKCKHAAGRKTNQNEREVMKREGVVFVPWAKKFVRKNKCLVFFIYISVKHLEQTNTLSPLCSCRRYKNTSVHAVMCQQSSDSETNTKNF